MKLWHLSEKKWPILCCKHVGSPDRHLEKLKKRHQRKNWNLWPYMAFFGRIDLDCTSTTAHGAPSVSFKENTHRTININSLCCVDCGTRPQLTIVLRHNARRLGEVADWMRIDPSYHKRSEEQQITGFHSVRHFTKPLVMWSSREICLHQLFRSLSDDTNFIPKRV